MPGTADRRLEEMGIALPGAPARTIGSKYVIQRVEHDAHAA
jgi:hypothetical protein